jgi:Zn-finger nucleic acid-binding protein
MEKEKVMAANKPNFKVLKETAEKFEIELKKGSIKNACESVFAHFKENFDPESLVECPVCKYEAPETDAEGESLSTCPYCGTPFLDAPPEEKPVANPKSEKPDSVPKNEKKEEEKHIVTPEQQKALDEAIENIRDLQVDRAKKTYEIGVWLAKISDDALWKGMLIATTDKDGKDVKRPYKNFFEFVKDQLDISRSGAYKYMLCARNFTHEQFLEVGVKKGELIARCSHDCSR